MEQWNNVELCEMSRKSQNDVEKNGNDEKSVEANGNEVILEGVSKSAVLQPGTDIKPKVTLEDVEALLRRLYGITIAECNEIISYDDRNYYIKEDTNIKNPLILSHWPHGYVFKVLNALDSKKTDIVDAQNQLLLFASKENIKCPRPTANALGKYFSVEKINGTEHVVRLLEFVPGKIFHQVPMSNYLLFQSGEYLAKVDRILKNFNHEAYDTHKTLWMMQSVPQLRDFTYALQDPERRKLVEEIISAFETNVLSKLDSLETQIIHGDYNEQNIIVDRKNENDEYQVTGIIDFGDTSRSPLIFEVGVALTYMLLQAKTLASGGVFLAGYNSIYPLRPEERPHLKYCVAARLAQSLTMGAYTHMQDPTNDYVLVTQKQGWELIEQLWRDSFDTVDELWQTESDNYLTKSTK